MIESLITSKTRIKLLLKLFLNSDTRSHLRGMERDFGESTNAIRPELNRFMKAGLISCRVEKQKKIYKANEKHPLFRDIQNILRKTVGIDALVEKVISRIGNLDAAYITGSFAEGVNSDTIELVLTGEDLDNDYIQNLIPKAEKQVKRKIVYIELTREQLQHFFKNQPILLIWQKDTEKASSRKPQAVSYEPPAQTPD